MPFWRRPVFHFVALGAALFALDNALSSGRDEATASGPIVITAERVDALREEWLARTGRMPSARDLDALIDAEVDDELLIREARRRGYHRSDSVVQQRLLRNMQFVAGGGDATPDELLAQAYALEMDRSDLVVRRRLAQRVQLEVEEGARTPEPDEAELRAYMAAHPERFVQPERVTLTHVFLSRDRRGERLDDDARALLARLQSTDATPEDAEALGDPFLFDRTLAARSESDLAKTFGPGFAAASASLPAGRWSGPVASAYGTHLVYVHERTPAAPTPLSVVRGQVREAVLYERGAAALRAYLDALRARAEIAIELPP